MPGIEGGTLREFRRSRGWDVPEMARQLRRAADGPVASPGGLVQMIYAWERGAHTLTERYELLYRKTGLVTRDQAEHLNTQSDGLPADAEALLDGLADRAAEFGRHAEAASVGLGTIEQLDDTIHRISREYLSLPPWPLILRASHARERIFGYLEEGQRLRYARDLYVVAAKCCAFLAWAAGDLGQLRTAAAEGRTALILAEEAGHPGAEALALCALSKTAFWDGNVNRAADFARRGYTRCPPNTTRILLACQEADAARPAEAVQAITRAQHAADDASAADELGGLFSCGSVRAANYAIAVHLKAGEPEQALRVADNVMPAPGEEIGYGTWGQISIGASIAHLRNREIDGMAERLAPVLALPPPMRLATLTARLDALAPVLTRGPCRTVRGAVALAEQIRAYSSEASNAIAELPSGEGAAR